MKIYIYIYILWKDTLIPRDRRAETAASRTCLRRPMIATEAPCLPNWVDISNPIPEPPPVIKATLPFNISALNGDSNDILLISLSDRFCCLWLWLCCVCFFLCCFFFPIYGYVMCAAIYRKIPKWKLNEKEKERELITAY